MKSLFQPALTLSAHLLLCALVACAMLLSPLTPTDATAGPVHQQSMLQVDLNALAAQAADALDAAPTDSASTPESVTADLAGDMPELLLITPLPLTQATRVDQQMRQPLYALPHPFLERPQRPPRETSAAA